MIAGDVGDFGAVSGIAEDQAEDLVVGFVPIPGFAEPPAVYDVAHQIEFFAGVPAEEVDQEVAAAAACSEVGIGDEDGSVNRS